MFRPARRCDAIGVRRDGRAQSGQAVVETAIVMPLFTFLLLGLLQITLMHQARLMTRYAAYKAARAGSIDSAKMHRMEQAALSVLVPLIAKNGGNGQAFNYHARQASEFVQSYQEVKNNQDDIGLKWVEVTICSPNLQLLQDVGENGDEVGFDAKDTVTGQDWKTFDKTRLSIQVTFNYRMVVPFANMFIWHMAYGDENLDVYTAYRLGYKPNDVSKQGAKEKPKYDDHPDGIYVFPIRANWAMRMQSNLFPKQTGYELPQGNDCIIRFPKKGGGDGGGGTVDQGDPDVDQN